MMHALDYDRALGELLELDDTVRAVMERTCSQCYGFIPVFITISRLEKDWRS
jgi:hypothetical protein